MPIVTFVKSVGLLGNKVIHAVIPRLCNERIRKKMLELLQYCRWDPWFEVLIT